MKKYCFFLLIIIIAGCANKSSYRTIGSIEKFDPSLDSIISSDAKPEIIADSLDWSEGPLWVEKYKMLLFSDVPQNTIYKWTEEKGKQVYLTPSGYTDTAKRGGEMGSNGLTLDNDGNLILTQCGNRQIALMNAPLDNPAVKFTSIAGLYKGKKFNSPNDVIVSSIGEVYFTDPPVWFGKKHERSKKRNSFPGSV